MNPKTFVALCDQQVRDHPAAGGVVDGDAAESGSLHLDEHRRHVLIDETLRDLVAERKRHDDQPVEAMREWH